MLSFLNVWASYFSSPLFLTLCQTYVGGFSVEYIIKYLSEAHAVGSVSDLWCPPFREIQRIVIDCGR